jgi:signal transduction histidine kinase
MRVLCLAGATIIAAPVSSFAQGNSAPSKVGVLTNVAQILDLSSEQAKANPQVRILGMVTCYDAGTLLFVQDQTSGIFVYSTDNPPLALRPGQYVEVTGVANVGRYSPIIASPVIKPLEAGPKIIPRHVSLAQIHLGGLDAQWVELTAVVRAQEVSANRLCLNLVDPPHRINVLIPNYKSVEKLSLEGCLIRVRGVVGVAMKDRDQVAGLQVFANSLEDVAILEQSPGDVFTAPLVPIADLARHFVHRVGHGRVRVNGIVTLNWPTGTLYIQDSTGGLEVHPLTNAQDFTIGRVVDASGYLGPILEPAFLEDAVIRKSDSIPAQLHPVHLSLDELSQGHGERQLVEVEARLLGRAEAATNGTTLLLQNGNRFLTAHLEGQESGTTRALKEGSQLRLIGVSNLRRGLLGNSTVALLLRSPQDIEVVALPAIRRGLGPKSLAITAILTSASLGVALFFIQKQRRRTEHLLQLQAGLQAEMRQGEQQLRRSLEERERIARDLHDDIIQSIYAVGLNLEDCRRRAKSSLEGVEQRLSTAIHTLNTTIRSVRGFITGLEPKVLNGREFKTALKSLALTSGDGLSQFQIEVDPTGANLLTSTQATQLLHIAKESMSNSLRHAQASTVKVALDVLDDGICLEVRDDGAGFDPFSYRGPGHGLRNITARAHEIGARLQIISSPGKGCRIIVNVPRQNMHEPS